MLQGVNALYTNNDWNLAVPYIYTNNQWVRAQPKGYTNNEWLTLGAAGTLFYTSDGELFLVRDEEPVLTGATLLTGPIKTSYKIEEFFDPTGLSFQATYSFHGHTYTQIIYSCDYEHRPLKMNDTTFNVLVEGKYTIPINLTITDPTIYTNIIILNMPNKTNYIVGEQFNPAGMTAKLMFTYNNQIYYTETVNSNFSYKTSALTLEDADDFIISYTKNGITCSTSINLTVMVEKFRYIKLSYNGNSSSYSGNHLVEIQVFDQNNTNIALNKTLTGLSGTWSNLANATDNSLTHTGSSGFANGSTSQAECLLDLGDQYQIDKIKIWHYWDDSRKYYYKMYISSDNLNWRTIFDYSIDGAYQETSTGKIFQL